MSAITELIAKRLPSLVHPGDDTHPAVAIPMPTFNTAAMPADVAEHFAEEAGLASANIALLTAEAIVHVIQTDGESSIIPTSELEELRATAAVERTKHRQPRVCCSLCGNPLFRINVDTTNPIINGKQFLEALATLNPDCPHQPKAAA